MGSLRVKDRVVLDSDANLTVTGALVRGDTTLKGSTVAEGGLCVDAIKPIDVAGNNTVTVQGNLAVTGTITAAGGSVGGGGITPVFGEVYISREAADYGSCDISSSDHIFLARDGFVSNCASWSEVGPVETGWGCGTQVSGNALVVEQDGIYRVDVYVTGTVEDLDPNFLEVAFGVNGPPVENSAAPTIIGGFGPPPDNIPSSVSGSKYWWLDPGDEVRGYVRNFNTSSSERDITIARYRLAISRVKEGVL